jgi:hypothetical protein
LASKYGLFPAELVKMLKGRRRTEADSAVDGRHDRLLILCPT